MPAPQAVKGFHMKAFFDVDEKGNAKLIGFNPTRDGDYNRRVADVLRSMRFRPGGHPDGTPKRDTAGNGINFLKLVPCQNRSASRTCARTTGGTTSGKASTP